MIIRIFDGITTEVEYQIQDFLNNNKNIKILFVTQSIRNNLLIITIIYKTL